MNPSLPDRVLFIVLDSVGVGELPDASAYGDEGSDTLGNIARQVSLRLPTLRSLGLDRVVPLGGDVVEHPGAAYGRMAEVSAGKDSVTGHWELMGLVLDHGFPTFPDGFPALLMQEFERRIGRRTLGNKPASGTAIIDELGVEHVRTGWPIVYTSADSVFQIAAHEQVIPLPELYRFCEIAYEVAVDGLGLGRVIARPFVGEPGQFRRNTAKRRDYAMPPKGESLLDHLKAAGWPVVGIGKVDDLFAGKGLTEVIHTKSDDHGMDEIERALTRVERGLVLANLVDFDTVYGHRNDVEGYAANLERFDARLARLLPQLGAQDLLVITADHGNDPTTPSTDHSREYVPVLLTSSAVNAGTDIGIRGTFADLGQTLAELFGVGPLAHGTSFLGSILRHRGNHS